MGKNKKILIIHPQGNIYNNPNFYALTKLLNNHYDLNLLIPKIKENDGIEEFENIIILYDNKWNIEKRKNLTFYEYKILFNNFIKEITLKEYDLIIGSDREGVIDSYFLSKIFNIPYIYISYEIFFKDEVEKGYKDIEQIAIENSSLIIIQDELRKKIFMKENSYYKKDFLLIPISSSGINKYRKSNYLYKYFDIKENKKILLYMGSIGRWSCIDKMLELLPQFPKDWVIVIHNRYGETENELKQFNNNYDKYNNLYISNIKINTTKDMHKLIHSADLGVAFYCPTYDHKCTGKNIENIGLSSGKINTYLQNGLPIVTNNNPLLSKLFKKYDCGYSINDISNLPIILKNFTNNGSRNKNCNLLFKEVFDFNLYKDSLTNAIERILNK